jgi:hypothetical protein
MKCGRAEKEKERARAHFKYRKFCCKKLVAVKKGEENGRREKVYFLEFSG